jgi:hypothetical protein
VQPRQAAKTPGGRGIFLGNGVTVARLALNQLVQVQILVPQLETRACRREFGTMAPQ